MGQEHGWLSVTEAAAALGISVHAVRRRIKSGDVHAEQVRGRHGPSWRVSLDLDPASRNPDATLAGVSRNGDASLAGVSRDPDATVALMEALRLVDKLTQQNLELAGRVGFYQAQVQQLQTALEAPKTTPVVPDTVPDEEGPPGPATGLWGRFLGWLYSGA